MKLFLILFFCSFFITAVLYGSSSRENDPRKVVGIEFKHNFKNTGFLQNNVFVNVKTVKCVVNFFFGKVVLNIPVGLSATFSSFSIVMKAGDKEWTISNLKAHRKYNYTNIYGNGSLPTQADVIVRYHNIVANLSLLGNNYVGPRVIEKVITTIAPIEEKDNDSMKFIELTCDFSDFSVNSLNNTPSLSTFQGCYPSVSFVNDFPTTAVVKVISQYDAIFASNFFVNALQSIGTNNFHEALSDYITEIIVEPGRLVTMPDTNGCFFITANFNGDNDQDGLSDEEEFFYFNTNPFEPDTDFDGLNDFDEVYGKNICLELSSGDKYRNVKTIPFWFDSDGDGISDGDEYLKRFPYENNGVVNHYLTDPCAYDTDDDGLNDKVDPYPLISCFDPNDTFISSEWANYWSELALGAGISVNDILLPNADSDGDGINNLTEMKNRTCPVFTNGFRKYLFEPQSMNIPLLDSGVVTNSFSLKIFSERMITGAVFAANADWQPTLFMNGLSALWFDCPVLSENYEAITFACNNFVELSFSFVIDFSFLNKSILYHELHVVDIFGECNEYLPVNLIPPEGMLLNEAPSEPVLLLPSFNSNVFLEYHNATENDPDPVADSVDFSWSASTDPEEENVTYTFNLFRSPVSIDYSCSIFDNNLTLSTDDFHFECAYYYWNVIATDESENSRISKTGIFLVSIPGDEDSDGIDDATELRFGSDPYDESSIPLFFKTDFLKNGYAGREYYQRMISFGGKSKNCLWHVDDNYPLPSGLIITADGELRGVPEYPCTNQVMIVISDRISTTNRFYDLIIERPRNGLILKPGTGFFLERNQND